jgi:hypothetical protein
MNLMDSMMESVAPNTMALAREIDAQAANNPAQAQALASLTASMKAQSGNLRGIGALEELLGKDAQFKSEVRALALQNPAALEQILPQALGNPDNMKSLVAQTAAANLGPKPATAPAATAPAPQQAAARQPSAAPQVQSAVAPAAPAAPQVAPIGVMAAPPPAAPTANAAATGPSTALSEMNDLQKMAELQETPGYDDLMARIEQNDDLGAMFSSLMSGSEGDPQARSKALDDILIQTRKNPDMLTDLVKTIDEKPGVVSSIAGMAANDPKMAMTALGMYSQFNQGFGKMLDGLFGPGVLDKLLVGLMGSIAPMLSNSNALMLTSNNGGSLTQTAMRLLNGTPDEVTTVSPENGSVVTTTGERFAQGAENRTPPTPDPQDPNRNLGVASMVAPQPTMGT